MKTIMTLIAAACLASATTARADDLSTVGFETINSLMPAIKAYKTAERVLAAGEPAEMETLRLATAFAWYVSGVADACTDEYDVKVGRNRSQICAVVLKYVEAHPEQWDLTASDVVRASLVEAFPKKNSHRR